MTKRETKVSEITFYPIIPTSKGLICYVSFTYNNELRINDCGIYTKPNGDYRILYPVKVLRNGKVISSVYPINKKIGKYIEDFLLSEYNKFVENKKGRKNE